MATTIKLKNSVTTTNAPSSLVQGEVAINITDKKVWVGNAATTPIQLLGDGGSASFTSIAFGAGTVSNPSITFTGDTNTGIYSPAADTIAFTEGGVESMRIDSSGNVGIGTSSPSDSGAFTRALDLNGASGAAYYARTNGSATNWTAFGNFGVDGYITNRANGVLRFATNNTEYMRIDSSGNVGIGTSSPAAKLVVYGSAPYLALQNSTTGATANDGFQIQAVGADAYVFNYENSFISFGTNASERMRITSTGDLLLGTTSSTGGKFHMQGNYARLTDGTYTGLFGKGSELVVGGGTSDLAIRSDAAILFSYGSTERMRITNQGYVGIGVTNPTSILEVTGGAGNEFRATRGTNNFVVSLSNNAGNEVYVGPQASSPLVFQTANAERMRITSGGDLLVGTTDTSQTAGAGFKIIGGRPKIVDTASTSSTSTLDLYSTGASAYRFYVNLAGTIFATSTTITGISDGRLKENVRDLDDGLNAVMALKPRKFDWKEGKGKNIKGDRGFIAQEFETIFPDMIETWKDPTPEGEEPYKGVNPNLIPTLVKAIQEQQAMIEELKQEVAKLKGV